jgi:hypothetical protein
MLSFTPDEKSGDVVRCICIRSFPKLRPVPSVIPRHRSDRKPVAKPAPSPAPETEKPQPVKGHFLRGQATHNGLTNPVFRR